MRLATKTPATSAMKVGLTTLVEDKDAVLPVGLVVSTHLYVNLSALASELAAPVKITVAPMRTVCAGPALATGAALSASAMTVVEETVALSAWPSFTIKLTTKVPAVSAVKVGLELEAEARLAKLLVG